MNSIATSEPGGIGDSDGTTAEANAFYGGLALSEYTMTHELGHRFRGQAGDLSSGSIYYQFQSALNFPELDCGQNGIVGPLEQSDDRILFGVVSSNWWRGVRGWGTTVTSGSFSGFQQNPAEDGSTTRDEDIPDEAFGDTQ